MFEVEGGAVTRRTLDPSEHGIGPAPEGALRGGGPAENAARLRALLSGKPDPAAETVALNAGAALFLADAADDVGRGIARARAALAEGSPLARLDDLIRASNAAP